MNRFLIKNTSINDLIVIHRKPLNDDRGYFERLFCHDELKEIIADRNILQINHSYTVNKGTVRGMHYQQLPYAELKLVSCLKGEVFDVAVDLRKNSPTFLNWHAEILSESNNRSLVIPEGFAHGFQLLSNNCELIYMTTAFYRREFESGLDALDKQIGIDWPLDISYRSTKDQNWSSINNLFRGIEL